MMLRGSPVLNVTLVAVLTFLFVGLLFDIDNPPAYAAEPDDQPVIPSHRVGHLAKTQNLDTIVAQSEGTDPLSGNYRLASDDEIVTAFRYPTDSIIHWETQNVSDDLNTLTLMYDNHFVGEGAAVATGRFNADHYDDFAFFWRQPNSAELSLAIGISNGGPNPTVYSISADESAYLLPLSIATGDFDGDGIDEIAIGWEGGGDWANIKIYDISMGTTLVAVDKIYDEVVENGNMDIAAGDLDGDGNDEIVLGWCAKGNTAGFKVYDVDKQGKISPKARWTGGGGLSMAVGTGDFDGDGIDEAALAGGGKLSMFDLNTDLNSFFRTDTGYTYYCDLEDANISPVDLQTGDFNVNGMDEIAVSCWGDKTLRVIDADKFSLHEKAVIVLDETAGMGSIAVGDVNRDLRDEIVVGWYVLDGFQPATAQKNYLQVLQVSTDLNSISVKGKRYLGESPPNTRIDVALGDLDGDSLRVGTPTYQFLNKAVQNIAIINAPPKHKDTIDGTTYDVNVTDTCANPPCTYAEYQTQQMTSSEMSLTTNRDWSVSTKLDLDFPFVKASMENSYGENFEKTTSSFRSMTFGQDFLADHDDAIVETVQLIDVWEYPVYKDISDTVVGHILVTWPRKVDPTCTSNCSADMLTTLDGLSPNARYMPNHVFGNALSYSSQLPSDIKEVIKSDTAHELGVNPYEMWIEWSDVKDSEDKKSSNMDLQASLEVDAWGQGLSVTGDYSQGSISVHKVSFESDTSFHLYFTSIDGKYRYSVQPVFYWAKPDGHLVLDYAVAPVTADPPTWWQDTYNLPDPAFSLPWYSTDPAPGYEILTREITFEPRSPTVTDTVTISARIRNFSLVGVDDVKVALYVGDPDNGGTQIGTDQTISATLEPMSSYTVSVHLDASGYGGQTLDIYGVVDPHNAIAEIHDDTSPPNNNKAYALLPVKSSGASTRPKSLLIDSMSIDDAARASGVGTTVNISATVRSMGADFTYIMVEFWDGNPHMGGTFIGAVSIPMILADETASVGVEWDTSGLLGAHHVWVNAYSLADVDDLVDNGWANEVLELAPYEHYLPKVDVNE